MKKKQTTLSDFLPPDSVEMERQVIIDAVYAPDTLPETIPLVERTMFTDENRARIWEMMVWMHNTGNPIDLLSVKSRCGQAFIIECVSPGLQPSNYAGIMTHVKTLRDISARRRAYISAIAILEKSVDMNADEATILDVGEKAARDIAGSATVISEKPISAILNDISQEMAEKKRLADEGKMFRIPTGIPSLDWMTYKGWNPGQLIVLAARPSVGKTSLMLKFAKAGAAAGFPTVIYSLEMTAQELGQKLLFSTGGIYPEQVAAGTVSKEAFAAAAGLLSNLPIIVNADSVNLDDIVSHIMIDAKAGRCKVAYVDYLGLMRTTGDDRVSTNQAISQITRTLKVTAKRAGIPIILLCQLNRNQAREKRAPELYDLRDSGSIEQDADIVMMLEHTDYKTETEDGEGVPDINIWVRKNRQYIKDVCVTVRPNSTYSEFYDITNLGAGK